MTERAQRWRRAGVAALVVVVAGLVGCSAIVFHSRVPDVVLQRRVRASKAASA
jgi:predicted benzoate:H+ symporter BenE